MNPGSLLLALIKAGSGVTAPSRPEQHDMEKKPEPGAPITAASHVDGGAWAYYAGLLEALLLAQHDGHPPTVLQIRRALEQNPLRRRTT